MPNRVTGSTDITGAMSVIPGNNKTVCVVGAAGTTPSEDEVVLFDVYSVPDAETKFGSDATAPKLIDILIKNGVTSIKGIMSDSTQIADSDKYDKTFTELMKHKDIDIIIIDTTDSTIITALKNHLDVAEAEDLFRYAVIGSADTTNNGLVATAASAESKRIFLAGPDVLGSDGNPLGSLYVAAGLAALLATETQDPALPMNGVEMKGFYGVDRILLKSERDALIAGGVVPLYNNAGNPTVYRLVTTDTTNEVWQEGTTVMIADDVLASVQERIRTNYKRTKNVVRILDSMKTDVIDVLQTKNDLEIIENFDPKTVSVIKDPSDLYGVLIDYEFDVVTPLYTVTIKQHMKL